MGFNDDMSDEEKKLMFGRVQSEQSPEQELPVQPEMANIAPIKGLNDQYNSQTPSYASQHVPPDVSQALNVNESNIDSQQAVKQAALEKLIARAGTLTPMNQKIAEGMGGMGSIKNVAAKAIPLAERASASFLQKSGPEAISHPSAIQQYATLQNAAKALRNKAMQIWEAAPHSPEAIKANQQALSAELTFNKARNRFNGQGYANGGVVQPSGMGDVKQSDRDLDSMIRQLDAAKAGSEQMPNVTNAFGGDAEKIYRSQSENYGPNANKELESRMPDEYAYGNIFKKAKTELSGESPNYLPSPYKSPDIEADAFNKDYMRGLRQSPESIPQNYIPMRDRAEELAADSYDKDFLHSKDFVDYLNKLKDEENVDSEIGLDKSLGKAGGWHDSETNRIGLGSESKGSAMHEIGHAKLDKNQNDISHLENNEEYNDKKGRNADILRNYLPQLNLREEYPNSDNVETRKRIMNRAVDEGRAQLIAEVGSGGHHAGYANYPVDKTLDEYKNRLDQQGFERQQPETNPKFERVRSLIDTIRNLNDKKQSDGVLESGNIDLQNRPRVKNEDGSISTVRSIGVNINGKEILIPTVSEDGRIMSNQEAIQQYKKTGKHLGIFNSPEASNAYAKSLHESQANLLNKK